MHAAWIRPGRLALYVTLLLSWPTLSWAQDTAKAAALKELAAYSGSDRHERLIEAAKKENGLTVYHVYPGLTKIIETFSKKYGIKVKTWRAGSEAVLYAWWPRRGPAAPRWMWCKTMHRRTRRRTVSVSCKKCARRFSVT